MSAYVSVAEAAAAADLHPRTIRRMLAAGEIPGRQTCPGAPWRVDRSWLVVTVDTSDSRLGDVLGAMLAVVPDEDLLVEVRRRGLTVDAVDTTPSPSTPGGRD